MRRTLRVDPSRVRILETAIRDFRKEVEETDRKRRLVHRVERQFRNFYLVGAPRWRLRLRKFDWRERMIPAFASIGAVRSGTSTLAQYILQHPCVVLPLSKEPGLGSAAALGRHLPTLAEKRVVERRLGLAITGICTPAMPSLMFPHVARALNPDMRIVVCIRNPTDRLFSHWRHDLTFMRRSSSELIYREMNDFERVVRAEIDSMRSGGNGFDTWSGQSCGYLQHGIYVAFLEQLYRVFDKERIKVVCAEELFTRPDEVVKGVHEFLGLPSVEVVPVTEPNSGQPGRLDPSVRRMVDEFYRPFNERLVQFLGRSLPWNLAVHES